MQLRRKLGSADEIIIPRVDYFLKAKYRTLSVVGILGNVSLRIKGR